MKAIVFDFDGTVSDTIPGITEAVNLTMKHLGFPEHTEAEALSFINNGARELIRRALPEAYRGDAEYVESVLAFYHQAYASVCLKAVNAYAGIPELIERLHRTYRIGVLSNKQQSLVEPMTRKVLPAGSFDAVVGFEFDHPGKPDPYLTRKLISRLGVEPGDCVMVGDSDVDVLTARNAGMTHVGVSWGYRDKASLIAAGATRIADTPEELAAILASL